MKHRSTKSSKIITFIGAGIILVTFLVKDVMNERLKDVSDSLASANTFYMTQAYNIFLQDDLAYIKQEVDLALAAIQNNRNNLLEGNEQALRAKAQAGDDHSQVVLEYVRNLVSLMDKIPKESSKAKEAKGLLTQCTQLSNEMSSLQKQLPDLLSTINHNPKDPQAIAKLTDFVNETASIPAKNQMIMNEATKLTQSVVSDLSIKEKDSERNYKRTTTLSYILFALGWVTGLAGQLLGLGDQDEP